MIYATIDVDLVDHEKAVLAGVAAMGLWTWGMLWLRKHKSSTGIVPAHMVVACSWGDRGTTVKLAAKLVASGLWSACEGGYLVHNYAEKNDTRDVIDARIAERAAKQQAYRDRKKTGAVPVTSLVTASDVTGYDGGNVTGNVTSDARVPLGVGARVVVSSVSSSGVQGGPSPADDSRPVSLDEPITAGALGRVEAMAMAIAFRPADVAAEWLKYLGKVGSKWPRSQLEGNWQSWLIEAKRIAAKDARRDAASATPRKAAAVQQEISPKHLRGKEF